MSRFLRRATFLALGLVLAAVVAIGLMTSGGLRSAHAQPECVELELEEGLWCVSLDPETATNNVGTTHTVTASVTFDGDPVADVLVGIEVFDGPNAGDFDEGSTNASGQFSFTYTGDGGPGTDIIGACDIVEELGPCLEPVTYDVATKEWVEPTPTITLEPPTATNVVGTDHSVTATFTIGGEPLAETTVYIWVNTGPNAAAGAPKGWDVVTDASGQAMFTYTSNGEKGTDTIWACFIGQQPEETVCAEASKVWTAAVLGVVQPPTTPEATPTPTPTAVAEAVELPTAGGEPSAGSSSGLPWLAAIAGAIAVMSAGGFWFAYQRRRVR